MKSLRIRLWLLGLAAVICAAQPMSIRANETARPARELSFGTISSPSLEQARGEALDWLKSVKNDPAALKQFDAIWANEGLTILDKVAETLALGSPEAAKLLADAQSLEGQAPKEAPTLLRDGKQNAFFVNNLALAYGKALSIRRIHEDALAALLTIKKTDSLVDPAAYYFYRAVSEHALLNKDGALRAIDKVYQCADAPERYKMVALLMQLDMQTWQEKGLARIGQDMNRVAWRLEQARAGAQTQKIEAAIIRRLDEEIKRLENPPRGPREPGVPGPGTPGGPGEPGEPGQPGGPASKSMPGGVKGAGKVDPRDYKGDPLQIGTLPEIERARAMMRKIAELPPEQRKMIEDFYKKVAIESTGK